MALVLGGCGGGSSSGNSSGTATGTTSTVTSTGTTTATSTAGTATVTWVAPTENINGTPVTGLAGYRVYYGTSADALTESIEVPGTATTTYAVSDLSPGTYYFAVTAYNALGVESAPSDVASATI